MTADAAPETTGAEQGYHERFVAERAGGRFVVPRCLHCGDTFWHPRGHCPHCGSSSIEYVEPAWPASVYTYTINHRPQKGDVAAESTMIGYVELEDGLRLLANLELGDRVNIIGTPVRPEARHADGDVRFVFVPATGA